MAPTPQDNTPRLFVDYTSMSRTHQLLFRFAAGIIANDAAIAAHAVCSQLKTFMRANDSFYGARFADSGNPHSFPAPWAPINGTGSNDAIQGDAESFFVSFEGRGVPSSARVKYTFFTGSNTCFLPANNRFRPGQADFIDQTVALLQDAANPTQAEDALVSIAGDNPIIYTYANAGYNGHWQRKQRRGG